MFPRYPGGSGAGRGVVVTALALVLGTAFLLVGGDGSQMGTSRLEATQASVVPLVSGDEDTLETVPVPVGPGAADDVAVAPPTSMATATAAPAPPPAAQSPTTTTTNATALSTPSPSTPVSTTSPVATATTTTTATTSTATTTTATAAPAPPPTGPARAPGAEAEVVGLTNEDRSAEGLGSLTRNGCLDSVASRYAEQMARRGVLAHNPDGGPAVAGCRPGATWADNVGTSEPCDTALLEKKWMASAGHRRNILTGAFQLIGVGAWTDEQGGCWVQVLFST